MIPKNSITYKQANNDDLDTLFNIENSLSYNQIYAAITNKKEFEKYFTGHKMFLVIYKNNPIGYFAYKTIDKEISEITGFALVKEYQSKGIGTYMMDKIMDDLINVKKIKIFTSPENIPALILYLKNGFVIKEWKDNYFQGQSRVILYKIKKQSK